MRRALRATLAALALVLALAPVVPGCEGGEGGGAALPARFTLAVLADEPRLTVVHAATLAPIVSITLATTERPTRLAWAPGEPVIVSLRDGSASRLIAVDTLRGEPRPVAELDAAPAGLDLASGGRVLVTSRDAGALVVLSLRGAEPARYLPCAAPGSVIAIGEDRALVACPDEDRVAIVDLASGSVGSLDVPGAPSALASLGSERAIAVSASARSASVLVLDAAPRALDPLMLDGVPEAVASTSDERAAWIAIAREGDSELIEVIGDGTVARAWGLDGMRASGLAISSDAADAVATDRVTGRARVIDLATGATRAEASIGSAPGDVVIVERR